MQYKLTPNRYFSWHRGNRGIRAFVVDESGRNLLEVVGNQGYFGTEYTLHRLLAHHGVTDEFLFAATRRKDRLSQLYGNSVRFSSRAEILEFLGDLP